MTLDMLLVLCLQGQNGVSTYSTLIKCISHKYLVSEHLSNNFLYVMIIMSSTMTKMASSQLSNIRDVIVPQRGNSSPIKHVSKWDQEEGLCSIQTSAYDLRTCCFFYQHRLFFRYRPQASVLGQVFIESLTVCSALDQHLFDCAGSSL